MKAVLVPAASLTGTERATHGTAEEPELEKENTGGGVSCSHSRSGREQRSCVKADAESNGRNREPGTRLHRRPTQAGRGTKTPRGSEPLQ